MLTFLSLSLLLLLGLGGAWVAFLSGQAEGLQEWAAEAFRSSAGCLLGLCHWNVLFRYKYQIT